jgi:membrane protease YdiL (CAAX protease family)
MKLAFDPIGKVSLWQQRALVLLPAIPLLWVTDLTAPLWLGSTAMIIWLSRSARDAVFQMIYRNWWTTLAIGLVLGTLVGTVLNPAMDSFAELITGTKIDLSQFADVRGNSGAFMELLIVALLFGGVVEELAFRGFFIGWGTKLFGMKAAIPLVLLSSVAFGIGHLYQDLAGGVSTALFALLLGGLYLLFDRKLLSVILIHAVSNFWGVLEIYRYGV